MSGCVVIAISTFRSDEAIVRLLSEIFADPHSSIQNVIVVDSLGSGDLPKIIEKHGWPVIYENNTTNLGSAGNLSRRMELAASLGAAWCLCLNHDAHWKASHLSEMLTLGCSRSRVGAVYPILDHSPRRPRWEDGRRHFRPTTAKRVEVIPLGDEDIEVLWSSSNHALYSTEPMREGIEFFGSLWMMYEDLAYGVALSQGNWLQLVCRTAVLTQGFDYGKRRILGREVYIPEKPIWYSYYNIRNLILIRRRYGPGGVTIYSVVRKAFQSAFRITVLEDRKFSRLKLLCCGVMAGLFGENGKGKVP